MNADGDEKVIGGLESKEGEEEKDDERGQGSHNIGFQILNDFMIPSQTKKRTTIGEINVDSIFKGIFSKRENIQVTGEDKVIEVKTKTPRKKRVSKKKQQEQNVEDEEKIKNAEL